MVWFLRSNTMFTLRPRWIRDTQNLKQWSKENNWIPQNKNATPSVSHPWHAFHIVGSLYNHLHGNIFGKQQRRVQKCLLKINSGKGYLPRESFLILELIFFNIQIILQYLLSSLLGLDKVHYTRKSVKCKQTLTMFKETQNWIIIYLCKLFPS